MTLIRKTTALLVATVLATGAAACPGDFDNNGSVGSSDLLMMLQKMYQEGSNIEEDLNQDGKVDMADVLSFLSLIGNQCED